MHQQNKKNKDFQGYLCLSFWCFYTTSNRTVILQNLPDQLRMMLQYSKGYESLHFP